MLNYLSVTSGIAADTVAWGSLGWQCLAYAEIEPFPCAVLDYQYGCGTPLVAAIAIRGRENGCNVEMRQDGLANTILTPSGGRAGIGVGAVLRESSVRRLLPLECELLMGLPPGYTLIPFGRAVKVEKMEQDLAAFLMQCGCLTFEDTLCAAADGPRYKSHGNSIAIPPLRWLGERIEQVLLPVLHPELFGVQEAV